MPAPRDEMKYHQLKKGISLANKKGELRWINKESLSVDRSYQRDLHVRVNTSVKTVDDVIASNWSWPLCGAIVVCERLDGSLMIIDGQHRHSAAMRLDEIEELPCIVFQSSGSTSEASAFVGINTMRRGLTSIQVYNAMIVAGNPDALKLQEVLESYGFSINAKKNNHESLGCPRLLMGEITRSVQSVRGIIRICKELCSLGKIDDVTVSSLIYLERTAPKGYSVVTGKTADAIINLGYAGLTSSVKKGCMYVGEKTGAAGARGISDAINRGKKHYPTKFHPVKDDDK